MLRSMGVSFKSEFKSLHDVHCTLAFGDTLRLLYCADAVPNDVIASRCQGEHGHGSCC